MAKHVRIDWSQVVGYRITEGILDYINQLSEAATELTSKRIELDTVANRDTAGLFLKPGILTPYLWLDGADLGISVQIAAGEADLIIRPGKAVTYRGQIIELDSTLTIHYTDPLALAGKTVILRYVTQDSDEIPTSQTYHPVTGDVKTPVKMKTFEVDLVDYNPQSDEYLNSLPGYDGDYVPLGKIEPVSYAVTYDGGYRRIALVSIPWLGFRDSLGWGHWENEILAPTDFNDRYPLSLYNFLACKGSRERTRNNPLGLTPEDIGFTWSHLFVSHGSGFSDWPTNSLAVSYSSGVFTVAPIEAGEWVYLVDRDYYLILTNSDIPAPLTWPVAGCVDQHYYLLRLYSDAPGGSLPTFQLEVVDLGDSQFSAITTLKALYTERHKTGGGGGTVGWIGLAVFRYTPFGVVLTGSSFSDDFWLKDSGGTHLWNAYRWFQATTTSTTDIVHDGKARTPYPATYSPTSWWTPGSKLLRDLIDYLVDTSIPSSDFAVHKNQKCDGSTKGVQASPGAYYQHWVDAIRIDTDPGGNPPYFTDLYTPYDWSQQCGRSVDTLLAKLGRLREIKRKDKEYNLETPPQGAVEGGIPLGAVNSYAYWASQIATEDAFGSGLENQYLLNALQNNERALKHADLAVEVVKDSGVVPNRNQRVVYCSSIPDSDEVLIVELDAELSGGTLTGVTAKFWVLDPRNLEAFDWSSPDVTESSIDVLDVAEFLRFEPAGRVQWHRTDSGVFFYVNYSAVGYSGVASTLYVGNQVLGWKFTTTVVTPHVASTGSTWSSNSVPQSGLYFSDILVHDSHLYLVMPSQPGGISSRYAWGTYQINSDGTLSGIASGTIDDGNPYSSEGCSIFYDDYADRVFLVCGFVVVSGGYKLAARFFYWSSTSVLTEYTPLNTSTDYLLAPNPNGYALHAVVVYANKFGIYISHLKVDAPYGIAYVWKAKGGCFTAFWRDYSTGKLLPEIEWLPDSGEELRMSYSWTTGDSTHIVANPRSSVPVPMSRVDLVGGMFASQDFTNPVMLPTTDRGISNLTANSVHHPNWCIANSKGAYPYISVEDYVFVAVGWHPVDEKLRLVSFRVRPWKAF